MRGFAQISALVGLLLAAAGLRAQEQPKATTPPPLPPGLGAEIVPDKRIQLSPEERLKDAEQSVEAIRKILTRAAKLQAVARREKDLLRLNCLKEKAIALKGLLRVGEQAFGSLKDEGAKGDLAEHEHQRIGIAVQRGREIGNEAEACIGEPAIYTGPVQVEIDIDPSIPKRDPTILPAPGNLVDQFPWLERPQSLSPAA